MSFLSKYKRKGSDCFAIDCNTLIGLWLLYFKSRTFRFQKSNT